MGVVVGKRDAQGKSRRSRAHAVLARSLALSVVVSGLFIQVSAEAGAALARKPAPPNAPAGNALRVIGDTVLNGYSGASTVALDSSGNLFSLVDGGQILKIAPDGTQSIFAPTISYVSQFVSSSWGDYFAISEGNLYRILPSGLVLSIKTDLALSSLEVADNHSIYATSSASNTVWSIDFYTKAATVLVPSDAGLNGPSGIAIERNGDLLIADTQNNRIARWSGGVLSTYATTGRHPAQLALAANGLLYVAIIGEPGGVTSVVSPDGTVSTVQINHNGSHGVAVDARGELYVATWNSPTPLIEHLAAPISAAAGERSVTVSWVPPADDGGSPITSYAVSSHPAGHGCTVTVSAEEIDSCAVTGLVPTVSYTFTVTATSNGGTSDTSTPSDPVTPLAAKPGQATPVFFSQGQSPETIALDVGNPHGVAVDDAGNLYVGDFNNGRLVKYDSTGKQSTLLDGVACPHGVAHDALGNTYVAALCADTVYKVAPDGSVSTLGTGLSNPTDIALGPDGVVYISQGGANHSIVAVHPDGSQVVLSSDFVNPSALAVDAAGDIFVVDYDTGVISKLTQGGAKSTLIGGVANGEGIAITAAGDIAVTWPAAGQVLIMHTDGSEAHAVGNFSNPSWLLGVVTSPNGDLYVSDGRNNSILHLPLGPYAEAASKSATVTWGPPADDGGLAITSYTVTADPGGAQCSYDATTDSGDHCTVSGLSNGTNYSFTVRAMGPGGEGPATPSSNLVRPSSVPDAPTTLVLTPRSPDGSTVVASWLPPADDGAMPITGYRVSSTPPGHGCRYVVSAPESDQCVISGLRHNEAYVFTVTATNQNGESSDSAPAAPSLVNSDVPSAPMPPVDAPALSEATHFSSVGANLMICGLDAQGNVYGLGHGAGELYREASDGTLGQVSTFAGDINASHCVVSPSGTVYYYDPATQALVEVALGQTARLAPLNQDPGDIVGGGIAVDRDGNLFIANTAGQIFEFKVNGELVSFARDPSLDITALAVSPDRTIQNSVYVGTSSGEIVKIDADGTEQVIAHGLGTVSSLVVDANFSMSYSIAGGSSVLSIDEAGNPVTLASSPDQILNLAEDALGNIYYSTDAADLSILSLARGPVASASNGRATVRWMPSSDDGGLPILSYAVTAEPGGRHCTYQTLTDSGYRCTITGLDNGTAYSFSVTASNEAGEGPSSASSAKVTPHPSTSDAPTSVVALAAPATATVSWVPPASDGGSPIISYQVSTQESIFFGCSYIVPTDGSPEIDSCTVPNLPNGKSFTFTVVAINAVGDSPASAASESVTPMDLPSAPLGFNGAFNTYPGWSDMGGALTDYLSSTSGSIGVAYDSQGNLYASYVSGDINKTTPQGVTTRFASGLDSPRGMFIDPLGNVFVVVGNVLGPPNSGAVLEFSQDGQSEGTVANGFNSPFNVLVTLEGDIWVSDFGGGKVDVVFAGSGEKISVGFGFDRPLGLALAPDGSTVYVSDYGTGEISAIDSNFNQALVESGLDHPAGMTTTPAGMLYVVEAGGLGHWGIHQLVAYSKSGSWAIGLFTGQMDGVALSPDGSVVVSDELANSLHRIAPQPLVEGRPGGARVSWMPSSDNGGALITAYHVSASPGSQSCDYEVGPGKDFSCVVRNLDPGTDYTFSITAHSSYGNSPALVSAPFTAPSNVPSPPMHVEAKPGNGYATLSWEPSISDGGSPILAYQVVSVEDPTKSCRFEVPTDGSPEADSCVVGGLVNGVSYRFEVTAENLVGSSDPFQTQGVKPALAPGAPQPAVVTLATGPNYSATSFDLAGNLYATAGAEAKVYRYGVDGSTGILGEGLSGPMGLAVDSEGNLYIADHWNNRVVEIAPDGTQAVKFSGIALPTDVEIDQMGNFWVSSDYAVTHIDPSGNRSEYTPQGGSYWAWPFQIAIDPSGNAYELDFSNQRVYEIYADLSGSRLVRDGLAGARGIAVDASGNLFIAQADAGNILEIRTDGSEKTNSAGVNDPEFLSIGPNGQPVIANWNGKSITSFRIDATAGNSSATIRWSPPEDDGGSQVLSYTATAVEDPTKSCTYVVPIDGSAETDECTVRGLAVDVPTPYTFRVVATNAIDGGVASEVSNAATPFATAPEAPSTVAAVAGNRSVAVSWTAPAFDGGLAVTSYAVTAVEDPTKSCAYIVPTDGSPPRDSCVIVGLARGVNWTFSVTATNSVGTSSATTTDPVVVTGPPSPPQGPCCGLAGNLTSSVGRSFDLALSMAISPMDYAFVVNASDGHVYQVDIGTGNRTDTGISDAQVVATDQHGNLYVARSDDFIYEFDANLTLIRSIPFGLHDVWNMAVDSSGLIYITRAFSDYFWMIQPDGTVSHSSNASANVDAVAIAPDDVPWFSVGPPLSADNTIASYEAGAFQTKTSGVNASEMSFDENSNLYIASWNGTGGELFVYPPGGEISAIASAADGDPPAAVAISASGELYFQTFEHLYRYATAPTAVPTSRGGGLTVIWSPPRDDGGSPIVAYRATASPGGRTCSYDSSIDTGNRCEITNLDPRQTYTVTVIAQNALLESLPSAASAPESPLPLVPASPQGPPSGKITSEAELALDLNIPHGIALDAAGNLYIANWGDNDIIKQDPTGAKTIIGGGFYGPKGVAVDIDGNVYVADTGNSRVVEIKADGTQQELGSGFDHPVGLAVGPDGSVYVADSGNSRVVMIHTDGTLETLIAAIQTPDSLALSPDGLNLYVTSYDLGTVTDFSFLGAPLEVIASGLSNPRGIVVDSAGLVSVANQGASTIVRMHGDGSHQEVLTNATNALGLALDSNGIGYVSLPFLGVVESLEFGPVNTPDYGSISVAWSPPSSDGGSPIERYEVYDLNGVLVCTYSVDTDSGNSCSFPYTELGLGEGGDQFTVVAVNAVGSSPPSLRTNAADPLANEVPTQPLSPMPVYDIIDDFHVEPPSAVTFGQDGLPYAIDPSDGSIYRYPIMAERELIGNAADATGIAVSADGTVYVSVSNRGGSAVLIFPSSGGSVIVDDNFVDATGVAVNPQGLAYVVDAGRNSIYRLSPSGVETLFAPGLDGPWGITFDEAGKLFVSEPESQTIVEISPEGARSSITGFSNFPQEIAVDAAGDIFATSWFAGMGGPLNELTASGLELNLAEQWGMSSKSVGISLAILPNSGFILGGYDSSSDTVGVFYAGQNPWASASSHSANISWGDPAKSPGSEIDSYTVTATPGGNQCTYLTFIDEGNQCTVTGLTNGQQYRFSVAAHNISGDSSPSLPSAVVIPVGSPSAPSGLKLSRGNGHVMATWDAPTDTGGSPLAYYTMTASVNGSVAVATSCGLERNCDIGGLSNGTNYSISVSASNADNLHSPASAAVSITPGMSKAKPGAPSEASITPLFLSLSVSWTAPSTGDAVESYQASVKDSRGKSLSCTATAPARSCSITGLKAGATYRATVTARNAAGTSAPSPMSASASVLGTPGSPSSVSAHAGARAATISWLAPRDTGYGPILSYSVSALPGGATCTALASDASPLQCSMSDLRPDTDYSFTVVASNAVAASAPSSASAPVTPFDLPSVPSLPDLTPGDGRILVSGAASSDTGMNVPTTLSYVASALDPVSGLTSQCSYLDPMIGCMLPDLTNGTSYQVVVRAANAGGSSSPSLPSVAIPEGLPTSPRNLSAEAGNGSIFVSFDPPAFTGGEGVGLLGYQVDLNPSDGSCTVNVEAGTADCSGLTNGTSYALTVEALNDLGSSEPSAPVVATPATLPSGVRKIKPAPGNGSVSLFWQAPSSNGGSPITSTTVTAEPGGAACSTVGTNCTVNGLTNGTSYIFTVVAANEIGSGPALHSIAVVPMLAPHGSPTLSVGTVRATAGNASVTLSFGKVRTASNYLISAKPAASCVVTAAKASAVCSGLTNGTAYTFQVAAANTKGAGPWSAPSNSVTPVGPSSAPRDLAIVAKRGIIVASWHAPSTDGGSALLAYAVTVTDATGKTAGVCNAAPTVTNCRVNGLSAIDSYGVKVTAMNALGISPAATVAGVIPTYAFSVIATPTVSLELALGTGGAIYRSTDGGAHFVADSSPVLNDLLGVACRFGGRFCVAVGRSGTVVGWTAPDSGQSHGTQVWTQYPSGTDRDLTSVKCLSSGACIATATDGTLLYGAPKLPMINGKLTVTGTPITWSSIEIPGAAGRSAQSVDCTPGIKSAAICTAVGLGGLLVSVDLSGEIPSANIITVKGFSTDLHGIRCASDSACIAVGSHGSILSGIGSKLNLAKSWKLVAGGDSSKGSSWLTASLNAIACPSPSLCLAVGASGAVLSASGDAKNSAGSLASSWSTVAVRSSSNFTAVRCHSSSACIAVGGGHIFQITRISQAAAWSARQNA